jgi:8-oxo-dGTP pyrophosphatase MutT (NUDIX family)
MSDDEPEATPLSDRLAAVTGPADDVPEAIPAATVLLIRDGDEGLETLMLRRDSKLAFAGGMWVFPGGRVDADDYPADRPDDVEAAVLAAAVREAHEESGLVVERESLVAFSHWTPPAVAIKRFATWFFLAPAPRGAVVIDDGEIRDHFWARPSEVLRRRDEGELELAPPTWVSLDVLRRSEDVASALAAAEAAEVEYFVTQIARVEGGGAALWHGDAGYESADPDRPGPRHRLLMLKDGWHYERTI